MNKPWEMVSSEFAAAAFGDERLSKRLSTSARAIAQAPEGGFPQVMSEAELEGFYRFLNNERVSPEKILGPHVRATVERCAGRESVVCVQDTSAFVLATEREGLGDRRRNTFRGHAALAVASDGRKSPLGLLGLHTWARTEESASQKRLSGKLSYAESRDLPNEQDRWSAMVSTAESQVGDAASLIHVMDSEADDYALMEGLVRAERRFVIRLCTDRLLDGIEPGAPRKLRELAATFPLFFKQKVELRERRNSKRYPPRTKRSLPRPPRTAVLAIHAGTARVRAPRWWQRGETSLELNIVWVRESEPPEGQEPVDWVLATTEPLVTEDDVQAVVGYYRCRWIIEEFFKALKTGCGIQKRQLESYAALVNALAVFVPIAWNLLRLRRLSREPELAAEEVLTPTEIEVLRLVSPELSAKKRPTSRDVLLAVAKLGGHLKRNGDPGWQLLGRGYLELLMLCRGFLLAKSQGCDQS